MTDTICETFPLDNYNMVLISLDDRYEIIIQGRYKCDDFPQSKCLPKLRFIAFEIEKKQRTFPHQYFPKRKINLWNFKFVF